MQAGSVADNLTEKSSLIPKSQYTEGGDRFFKEGSDNESSTLNNFNLASSRNEFFKKVKASSIS